MTKELSNTQEIYDSCANEIKDAEIQVWKKAQAVAIEMHLVRGEIVRRYIQQFKLGVNATVAALAERGISQRTLENSLHIYDNHWKGDLEASLKALPGGDEVTVRKLLNPSKKEAEKEDNCKHCKIHCI